MDRPFGEASTAAASSTVQENVATLQFGSEFQDIQILSNAQVAVVLQVSAHSATTNDEELNSVYRKTQHYVQRFNSMNNPEKDHQEIVDELDNLQEYVRTCDVFEKKKKIQTTKTHTIESACTSTLWVQECRTVTCGWMSLSLSLTQMFLFIVFLFFSFHYY